ncbi:MAG: caspase family protein [Thermoguttaceae bacterium]|nr:caspase family protein [Thermoguttaceae bacterium]
MSQQGKQFLSGLVNRVFHSKKKTNAPSRRLGMEPLEDRQLLAVDPTLLAAANAEAAQTSTLVGPVVEFDLAALTEAKAASPSFSVSNGTFEETTLVSKPESFQATVGDLVSNATIADDTDASAAPDIAVSIRPEFDDVFGENGENYVDNLLQYVAEYSEMGWAATLANMLTYAGWGPSSEAVDPDSEVKPENQVFDYFTDAFTNDQSSLLYGLAWFMNGSAEYMPQGQEGWAQLDEESTAGNLFPSTTGQWSAYTDYCREILASDIMSPFYGVQTEYLSNGGAVGVEIRFSTIAGDATNALTQQPQKEWVTLWGFTTDDADGFYNENDKGYYTGMVVSTTDGEIRTIPVVWDDAIGENGAYRLVGTNVAEGQVPYVYSFTTLERMPGYGVEADVYEKNDTLADVLANPKADLGEIDAIVGDSSVDRTIEGNVIVLENLTLYSDAPNAETSADPVDYYAFSLGQTASNSDYILLEYQDAYGVAPLNVTLYLRGEDGALIPIDAESYGYEPGRYDSTFSKETVYNVGEDGKTYATTTCRHRVSLAGLNPGGYGENQFYLKVEFANPTAAGQINDGYKLTFHAGFDDSFEQNDEFEDVANAPAGSNGNLGVLFGPTVLTDLVLKQFNRNETSEVDWFRFEMTGEGTADSAVNLYYKSKFVQTNDGDLDVYLYKADDSDPRGYSLVTRSEKVVDNVESISLEGLEAGVYFVKIVGFKGASNVGYKLELVPGVCDVPDARLEVPTDSAWESPLVVTTQKQADSETEVFQNETTIGSDADIYLNYSVAISENADYSGASLALYINGALVDAADVVAALNSEANVKGMLASTRERLISLFTTGLDMSAGEALVVADFNIGAVSDPASLAGKYFDSSALAKNAVAIVLNPANYELGAFYAENASEPFSFFEGETVVVDGVEATYQNGAFVDADGNAVATSVGSTATLDRGNGVITLTKAFGTPLADGSVADDYVAKDGVAKEIEYLVDNNIATAYFALDNMDEDKFAPNANPSEVVENDNPRGTNPDLGVANIENLRPMLNENGEILVDENGDALLNRVIENLSVTGKTDASDAPISDWFKFDLKDDANAETQNYENAYVRILLDSANPANTTGDLDLYLYKAVLNDPNSTFEEAYATGAYTLQLVGKSSGVSDVETINFADVNAAAGGKANRSITEGTYFVRVAGFNGSANRYDLELGGFTQSGAVVPTDPQEYFNDETTTLGKDAVTLLNSVATLTWEIPNSDYVSDVRVRYRAIDADGNPGEWIVAGTYDRAATGCKIAGLEAGTKYEFQLQIKNYFTEDAEFVAPEGAVLEDGWLCASVEKSTADFLNEVVYRAVIVGVSDYPGTAVDLTAAANDAEAFRDALLADPQWAEENITLLKNSEATKTAVMNALNEVAAISDDNDVVVFYFAGGGSAGFVGGESVGYLKTYGSQRSQYVSSLELTAAFDEIAAGSKLFFLDGGQVAKDVEETAINYKAFADSLTNSTKNGASDRPAQTSVLTAGANGQISPVGVMQRSEFSLALTAGIAELQKVGPVVDEDAEAKPEIEFPSDETQEAAVSDGRVTMQEIADLLGADERLTKLEALPTYATNDVAEAVLANGEWSETDAFQEKWLAEKAIVVTTTVDSVDAHDGKISLREAAALLGTAIPSSAELVDGAKFTLGVGSVVTIGTTTGTLSESIVVEYVGGSFRTTEPCAVDTETKTVEFKKTNVAVSWTADDWAAGSVSLTDDAGVAVADVEFKLYATVGSQIVDDESFEIDYLLKEGSTLKTAVEGGETLYVVAEGQGYKLKTAKGEDYARTTGLYLETSKGVYEEVKLSSRANVEQNVEMTKIVFDESLAGQALTVDESQAAIVFANGGIIDATNLKGEMTFDASTGALRISGTELVSLIGVKITGATGSAIIVDEGAKFELANSLISDCDASADAVVSNAGWLSFVNVTFANCASESAMIANAATGALEIANSLFALNDGTLVADATGAFELADTNVDAGAEDAGFVDAANGDYRLAAFDATPVDRGSNAATRLACGLVLDSDLAGSARIGLGGGSVDAGAFEFAPDAENLETPSTVVTTFEDVVNPTDGEISLREAFGYAGTTYEVETELQEGAVLTTADGRQFEVKNGLLVEFEGVSGTQAGMFYALQGVYMVDSYGETTALEEEQVVFLADGTEATVLNGKLVLASGIPVQEGAEITAADGSTGALSYGAVADFVVGQAISVELTATTVENLLPAGTAFDAGTYVATFQKDGTFAATVNVTTTDEATNKATTTQVAVAFTLPAGAEFAFMIAETTTTETTDEETGETTTVTNTTYTLDPEAPLGVIATSRAVDMQDGVYTLLEALVEKIGGVETTIFEAGTTFTLERGVFYDVDGKVVDLPRGTGLISPDGAQVVYRASNFAPADLKAGDVLTLEDGAERIYKEGLIVYEAVTLGTTITFESGLAAGVVELERGEITVERAVTLDATTIGGLTIDAGGASRVFNVDAYRETSATASSYFAGLTLQNGAAEDGGLIYVAEGSNLKIADSTLKSATATRGGAVFNAGSFSIDANSKKTLVADVEAEQGGAIYNEGTLSVGLATIEGATANAEGGAIYNVGTATLAGATIQDASAGTDGGAVYNAGVLSATRGATISGSFAENGAAVYNVGTFSVNNATFADGVATGQGGALYNAGTASLTNAKMTGNEAGVEGGAVYNVGQFLATRSVFAENVGGAVVSTGSATLASSLVLANEGEYALAAFGADASLFLVNVTAVGNVGGVYASEGALTIYNSIIGGTVAQDDATFDAKYSMIETTVESLDATNASVYAPDFANFDETADWTEWNLRLGAGSSALDAASSEYAFYLDFNGAKVALKVDFNGSSRETGTAVDMGAYEVDANSETPSTVVTTLDDTFDPYDGQISLREAIKYAATATGTDEASRTVTFSPDLFVFDKAGTITLSNGEAIYEDPFGGTARQDLGAIVLSGSVVVTSEYVDEFGETKYYDITIDGRNETQLFVKTGEGDVEFRGFTFTNGKATGENQNGGAFELREGSLSLVDSVVANNYASKDGGAVYQNGGVFFAVNTVFYGNEAKRYGGAVAADAGKVYIYNSTIALNEAGIYGGVYSEDGLVTLANSIVAQNGGAQNVDVRAQNLEATTNLIGGMDAWRTVAGLNGNVVGTVLSPTDPRFVSTDPTSEDFLRLSADSPAINSGSNVYAFGPNGVRLKFDLNGDERVVGTVVDMGAYESQYLDVPSTVVTTLADVVDQADGLVSLREALAYAEDGAKITFDLADVADATLRLENGAITLDKSIILDASNIPGGLTIEGDGDRIFNIENGAEVTLENVVLTGGEAAEGGAIYMESGKLTAINCVIYGNEAAKTGGAIYAIGGDVKLLNTTIAGNEAQNFPGVYFGNANGLFELQNSIIASNASETSAAIENYDLHVTGTFAATASIVGAATEALQAYNGVNGVLVGSPEAFVDAGFVDEASNNYALSATSPAVNKGSNRLIGQAGYYASILLSGSNVRVVATDLNGDERLVGGTVDMGAYEYQTATEVPSVVVTTAQDVVDPFDGLISLREAIDYAGSAYSADGYVQKVGTEITFDASLAGQTIALAETLEITKCVTIDAVGLKGGLTLDAGGEFTVVKVDATPDSLASEVVLAGLTITGGFAEVGAGVYCVGGDVEILNCVIYGNEAKTGAGVRVDGGSVSVVNTTITKNEATSAYGGLYGRGGSVALRNSIIALNTVNGETDGADVYLSGEFTIRSTLIGAAASWVANAYDGVAGNIVGAPNAPVDPSFADWAKNDFALGKDADGFASVALNAGDNSLTVYPNGDVPASDAAGDPRFVGGSVDMGAYESPLGPTEIPSLIVTTAEDVVDPYDGDISLREAVAYANNYGLANTITFAESINGSTFYLNSELKIGSDLTIDGLANNALGIVLTTSNDVADQRIINVDAGNVVLNGLTITNRRSERLQAGLDDLSIAKGGAIYVRTGSVSVYNSLITENAAEKGSAVYVNEANSTAYAKLVNCTVVANTTNGAKDGAAIYAELGGIQLYNTIVALNETTSGDVAQDVYQGVGFYNGATGTLFEFQAGDRLTLADGFAATYREDAFVENRTGKTTTIANGATVWIADDSYRGYTEATYYNGEFRQYWWDDPIQIADGQEIVIGGELRSGFVGGQFGYFINGGVAATYRQDVFVDNNTGKTVYVDAGQTLVVDGGVETTLQYAFVDAEGAAIHFVEGQTIVLGEGVEATFRNGAFVDAQGYRIRFEEGQTFVAKIEATFTNGVFVDADGVAVQFTEGQAVVVGDAQATYSNGVFVDAEGVAVEFAEGDKIGLGEFEATFASGSFVDAQGNTHQVADGESVVVGKVQGVLTAVGAEEFVDANGAPATVKLGLNVIVKRGAANNFATVTYRASENATAYNSFVSRSDSLAALIAGQGCFIGSSELDLTKETNALFVDADNQDYHLNADALATNAGNNVYFQQGSYNETGTFNGTFDSLDLDGNRRIYYTTTDMGAFENQKAKDAPFGDVEGKSVELLVSTGADVVDPTDGKTSLREALALTDRMTALGYDDITIRFTGAHTVKVGETALQVNSPVTILGRNGVIDCLNANSAFLVDADGSVVIENLEIKNGSAIDGGGIKLTGGELVLANVLIDNCEAQIYGGALYADAGTKATLYNVTIAKNVAVDGAGVYGAAGSNVKIYNSIVATNRSATAGVSPTDVYFAGNDFELAYTLVGNAGTEANAAKLRAKSTGSQIGYGVDREINPSFINASDGNFRLTLSNPVKSPAIGTGSPQYVYNGYSSDLNGQGYGYGSEGGVSLGAYQVSREADSLVVTTLEDVVNPFDGVTSLREAINYVQGRDNIANTASASCGSVDDSVYGTTPNAMNDDSIYDATFYNAITFDASLAGGTIKINRELGGFTFQSGGVSWVMDYMIDASSLSGLGGITIDASELRGGFGGDGALFRVNGTADPSAPWYCPVHLDLRGLRVVGGGGTGVYGTPWSIATLRNCLFEGFNDAVIMAHNYNTSNDGGTFHIYNSTIIGNVNSGGRSYIYNSIVTGSATYSGHGFSSLNTYNSYVYYLEGSRTATITGGMPSEYFVDAANGDYRLARYSLAVNGGSAEYLRTLEQVHAPNETDLNGNLRVSDGIVDMGCYESQYMVDKPSSTVTTELDVVDSTDGLISIREALAYAEQKSSLYGNTVTFDASLDGKTIVLDGALELTRDISFDGGDVDITLSGDGKNGIFTISTYEGIPNTNSVFLRNLTLADGYTTKNGGAINIERGNVYMSGLNIYGCESMQYGGAIYAEDSEITLVDCRIGGNKAVYYGGVVNQFGSTVLLNCYVAENVGTTKNSDVWGKHAQNYANSKNNVIGFVKDITIVDGVYGNRVGTEANPLKPFVGVTVGNLEIKPETAWGGATTPTTPPVSASILDDAFAAFVDEDETELAIDLAVLEETVFDDDLFASFEQF